MINSIFQLLLLVWIGLLNTPQASASKPLERPAPLTTTPSLVITRTGYITSYNKTTRCPNYVAWHLTKARTYGNNQRSAESFTEDPKVPAPRATTADYYNSRFDRGHMCPAADNKWDAKAMSESFLLTNVCPQNHGLNKYEWNDVEMLCRQWARKYGDLYIVCGPLYKKGVAPRYIGKNRVRVPDAFFKVVLRMGKKPKAIAFVFDNAGRKQPVADAVCTVDEVEQLTGFDFFPALEDDIEQKVEAEATLQEW